MNSRKFIIQETTLLLLGELVCLCGIIGIFALLNCLTYKVVVGGILGALIAVGNFFMMAVASDAAADKAEQQDVKAGKAAIKASYSLRMIAIAALLILFAKSGHCNLIAMIIPLFLVFPILIVIEFFRKSGGKKS